MSSRENRMWGRFEHSLDDKGRVIVPQRFREKLGDEFVLMSGPSNHIRAYPMAVWDVLEEQIAGSGIEGELNEEANFLQRIYGNCEFVSPDQQNRLSIPRHLREWADLRESETAIIVGNGNRLELWSRANWEAYSKGFTAPNAAKAMSLRSISVPGSAPEDEMPGVPPRGDAG